MIYDCVIIGSGVAGLTASLYLARANKSVLIIEDSIIGGTTATLDLIENYPGYESISGNEFISKLFTQVSKLGVNIDFMDIKSINFNDKEIITSNTIIQYKTLIIATGTSVNKLNVENEKKYMFKGISYCAVCDGSLYKNKKIVVVTDGNIGNSSIEYLSNITSDLTIIDISNKYKSDKFKVYSNAIIKELKGENKLENIVFEIDNQVIDIQCNAVFVCLGKSTNLDLFTGINTKNGFILTDEDMHTNILGVYASGDIRYKNLKQIITACSDGAIAATEAIKYLSE